MPGRRVHRVKKAAHFKGKPHPFPRQRAADCFRSPSTAYHVWTIIGNFNVPTSLDGGGLYALRAGRCGCDSLSLAGSRQRVKSLRSSVRLRLGHILLARSSPELTPAEPSPNLPRARRTARLFLPLSLQSQTRQRKMLVSGLAIPSFARAFVFRLRGFRGAAGA